MNAIQQLIISYQTRDAFWTAAENVENDRQHQDYFLRILRARNAYASEGFLEYAMLVDADFYEELSDEDKATVHEALYDDLRGACMLGESMGALYLAGYYENGTCGFSQDYVEAWRWYSAGANLRESSCYAALARMVLNDHTAPKEYDEAYAYECAYRALMLGGDTLATVVQGYHSGFLGQHASAIEQTYLPRYEQEMKEQLEREQEIDEYDDDHEYLGDAY